MLTRSEIASEVRLFNLGPYFRSAYQTLRKGLREERLRRMRRQNFSKLGAETIALFIAGLTMVWMGWRALHGLATLGDLALFYQAFDRGQGLIRSLLGSVGQVLANTLYLGSLFTFLDLKPRVANHDCPKDPPARLLHGIHLRDISFKYTGSDKKSLERFNLFIPANKVVAIVGPNGAGKSTLLKLLCRFYDPEQGAIEFDGTDIRQFSLDELRRQIAVLFQVPFPYHATASENIALGNLESSPDKTLIEAAARSAGVHETICQLPQGYETMLGNLFNNGIELSGGERQRIAMARTYLKRSPIILLDEPTSFMDSWAEADWFDNFRALAKGRTAAIITHRFSIAMRADIIFVMDKGQIVESGSHEELVAQDGMYAQSWSTQMKASTTRSPIVVNPDKAVYEDIAL